MWSEVCTVAYNLPSFIEILLGFSSTNTLRYVASNDFSESVEDCCLTSSKASIPAAILEKLRRFGRQVQDALAILRLPDRRRIVRRPSGEFGKLMTTPLDTILCIETAWDLDYRVHPLLSDEVVYLEIPKSGCTTIKYILQASELARLGRRDQLEGITEDLGRVHERGLSPLPLLSALGYATGNFVLTSSSIFRFTVAQNPYSRVLSAYLDKIQPGEGYFYDLVAAKVAEEDGKDVTFSKFLSVIQNCETSEMDIHWRPQVALVYPELIEYTHIGRFEELSHSLNTLLDRISPALRPIVPEPTKRTMADSLLVEFFGPAERQIVEKVYEKDFEAFGYDTLGIAPISPLPR